MEELCASFSSSGRVKSAANQRDWSSSRSRNGDCTPVCSRWPSQLWSSNGDISRELRAAWQRQTVNGDAYISNGTRRAPKQALRLRVCEELCSGKQQNDGEMTETQSTRTGRKTRCHPGKHPGMLYIVTRDRGGRDDVMRKSPISWCALPETFWPSRNMKGKAVSGWAADKQGTSQVNIEQVECLGRVGGQRALDCITWRTLILHIW